MFKWQVGMWLQQWKCRWHKYIDNRFKHRLVFVTRHVFSECIHLDIWVWVFCFLLSTFFTGINYNFLICVKTNSIFNQKCVCSCVKNTIYPKSQRIYRQVFVRHKSCIHVCKSSLQIGSEKIKRRFCNKCVLFRKTSLQM